MTKNSGISFIFMEIVSNLYGNFLSLSLNFFKYFLPSNKILGRNLYVQWTPFTLKYFEWNVIYKWNAPEEISRISLENGSKIVTLNFSNYTSIVWKQIYQRNNYAFEFRTDSFLGIFNAYETIENIHMPSTSNWNIVSNYKNLFSSEFHHFGNSLIKRKKKKHFIQPQAIRHFCVNNIVLLHCKSLFGNFDTSLYLKNETQAFHKNVCVCCVFYDTTIRTVVCLFLQCKQKQKQT